MNKEEMSKSKFLNAAIVGLFILALFSINRMSAIADSSEKGTPKTASKAGASESQILPTKENPLIIDEKGKQVLIYTEVHEMNVHQSNVH